MGSLPSFIFYISISGSGIMNDWLTVPVKSHGETSRGWLTNTWLIDWLIGFASFHFFFQHCNSISREQEVGALNIKRLIGAVTVDPSGPWLPEVLVCWCCSVRKEPTERTDRRRPVRGGQSATHALYSPLSITVRAPPILLTPHVWPETYLSLAARPPLDWCV